jgi:hypothetical protein
VKLTRLFMIYSLACALPLYAQSQSQHKNKISKQHHTTKIKQPTSASKKKNNKGPILTRKTLHEHKKPQCRLVVTHKIQKNNAHPRMKSRKHVHLQRIKFHARKRRAVPPLMPIQKTVTLLPAIAPQDNVSIVEPPPPQPTQLIVLPPDSTQIEPDKDAPLTSRPQTMLILKKHVHSPKQKKNISMFSPLKDLFSFDIQPQKLLDTFSFMQLLSSGYTKQIEYLITIIGHQKYHHSAAPGYLLSQSIPLFISQQSTVDRAINMDGIKEATRVAVVNDTVFLI